jgi:hypothetical protein
MATLPGLSVCQQTLSTGLVASKIFYGTEDKGFFVHFNLNHITVVFCGGCGHGIDFAGLSVSKIAEKMINHWENGAGHGEMHLIPIRYLAYRDMVLEGTPSLDSTIENGTLAIERRYLLVTYSTKNPQATRKNKTSTKHTRCRRTYLNHLF